MFSGIVASQTGQGQLRLRRVSMCRGSWACGKMVLQSGISDDDMGMYPAGRAAIQRRVLDNQCSAGSL